MSNPIGWFEIIVDDMARAQAFYESVLAVQLSDLDGVPDPSITMKAFPSDMEKYGATGALLKMTGHSAGQNSVIVYFSCDDCAAEESRVESAGGTVERPKFSIGQYGFISLVKDTEGNVFGLHSKG